MDSWRVVSDFLRRTPANDDRGEMAAASVSDDFYCGAFALRSVRDG